MKKATSVLLGFAILLPGVFLSGCENKTKPVSAPVEKMEETKPTGGYGATSPPAGGYATPSAPSPGYGQPVENKKE